MMWVVGFIIIAVVAAAVIWALAHMVGRGEPTAAISADAAVLEANAAALRQDRPQDLTFELVLRGYRPDQVDAVVDALVAENQRLRKLVAAEPTAPAHGG